MPHVHSLPVKGLSSSPPGEPVPLPGIWIIAPGVGVHVGSGVNVGKAKTNVDGDDTAMSVPVGKRVGLGVSDGGM